MGNYLAQIFKGVNKTKFTPLKCASFYPTAKPERKTTRLPVTLPEGKSRRFAHRIVKFPIIWRKACRGATVTLNEVEGSPDPNGGRL